MCVSHAAAYPLLLSCPLPPFSDSLPSPCALSQSQSLCTVTVPAHSHSHCPCHNPCALCTVLCTVTVHCHSHCPCALSLSLFLCHSHSLCTVTVTVPLSLSLFLCTLTVTWTLGLTHCSCALNALGNVLGPAVTARHKHPAYLHPLPVPQGRYVSRSLNLY